MSVIEDLMNEFDMEMTLQTSRRYVDEIEGNITKIVCKMIVSKDKLIDNLLFTDLTIDNEQMMVVYGENEEDNVEINMIDIGMINSIVKVFNIKHKVFNEFSMIQYRFMDSKCNFKCLSLKTNILN